MAIRLFELHRILKPTGSLYLHCDHTASSYLRQLLDGVFGADKMRNEIVWSYAGENISRKKFARSHDTILRYVRSDAARFNPLPRTEKDDELARLYPLDDDRGRYKLTSCQNNAVRPNMIYSWRGITKQWRFSRETMEQYEADGLLVYNRQGIPRRKTYADAALAGGIMLDTWTDIKGKPNSHEITGYPTQKPIALAERIIKASTNPGDIVLDCFAGCAYAALAAEKLGRNWTACDINPRAWTVFKRQFNKGGDLPKLTCNDQTTGQQVMGNVPEVTIYGPAQLPTRTEHSGVEVKPLRPDNRRPPGSKRRDGAATTLLGKDEMLSRLLVISHGRAWCCGYRSAGTNGAIILGNYELDHIMPKSKGGDDEIYNRAPLCPKHNGRKGNRDITLDELRVEVAFAGELAEGMTPQSLIRLDDALRQAQQIFAEEYQRKHGKPFI